MAIAYYSCTSYSPGLKGSDKPGHPEQVTMTRTELADKIKGGWAGQVIGCTYGSATEFRFNGTMINDYTPIRWDSSLMLWWYQNAPGLYDDIYMDLTFVDVFERMGLDAPAKAHAEAFAHADYQLWHANQAARYNILNGIYPPESGYWENNPHADDIDFQIEADFIGLMSPGMVNSAATIADKIGHIMNYGDGWYGGVYVASMYTLAFYSNDIEFIVKEGLEIIPEESQFFQCIHDVINWYYEFPEDWKRTWFEVQRKWSQDIGCPDGVFRSFNIDAKVNAAYIVIGLLYSGGDFGKAIDISTRCGQDSDCNPASAAGIIGTMIGYSNIPDYWKQGIDKVEDQDFRYTSMSLNEVYQLGLKHALEMIQRNGGTINDNDIVIKTQQPKKVLLEIGFKDHFPVSQLDFDGEKQRLQPGNETYSLMVSGNGFTISGSAQKADAKMEDRTLEIEVYIDGKLNEVVKMPTNFRTRKHDVTWKFNLPDKAHDIKLKLLNAKQGYFVNLERCIVYAHNTSSSH
ncbi:MAG: ADP-ribosylglycohydrolase family protein [Bacteroidales bacterium]|nr:ADP-ribosylglycohydrolase family protein [Bacteroidales bacterium]